MSDELTVGSIVPLGTRESSEYELGEIILKGQKIDASMMVPKSELEAMKKRAECAEAVLADVLADIDGVEQPQLSIGKLVWWWLEDLNSELDHHFMSGRLSGVGREYSSVWRTWPCGGVMDFVPTKELFFSQEEARKGK